MRTQTSYDFEPLIDSKRTAHALGVSYLRLLEMVRTGILPPECIVRLGKTLKFRPEKIRDFIANGGQRERKAA